MEVDKGFSSITGYSHINCNSLPSTFQNESTQVIMNMYFQLEKFMKKRSRKLCSDIIPLTMQIWH
eukprot:CAMPEP_0113951458 /NCGR_PEP_ID=MMETSP1339-20121228/86163_1 /TAXON_ID=94617 /ORGANISM="Fibrocapsa japonica" /LENGTH=64 /DNA_ID=CAMNT_0000959705 /DNA_START=191 /DNA_END=385 /DNA_ORIENTATION=+ /assembly_acc=CAM_ASM_000762